MLVSAVVAGVGAGIILGGDLRRLGTLTLRWWPLLAAAILVRLAAPLVPFAPLPLYLGSFAAILVVVAGNLRLPGVPLIGVGAALNLAVVSLNGGMPVDLAAVAAAGSSAPHDPLHFALTTDTRLPALADVIPIGIVRSVYSLGDVAIAAGGFWLPFARLRGRATERPAERVGGGVRG